MAVLKQVCVAESEINIDAAALTCSYPRGNLVRTRFLVEAEALNAIVTPFEVSDRRRGLGYRCLLPWIGGDKSIAGGAAIVANWSGRAIAASEAQIAKGMIDSGLICRLSLEFKRAN